MLGSAYITVMHEGPDDLADVAKALGAVSYVETHTIQSMGKPTAITIFKAQPSTAREQAARAVWYVANVFPSKGAARDYIREKEQYT